MEGSSDAGGRGYDAGRLDAHCCEKLCNEIKPGRVWIIAAALHEAKGVYYCFVYPNPEPAGRRALSLEFSRDGYSDAIQRIAKAGYTLKNMGVIEGAVYMVVTSE